MGELRTYMNEISSSLPPSVDIAREMARGQDLLRQGRVEEAVVIGERLVAAWPQHAVAHAFAAEVRNVEGRFDIALEHIDGAIALSDDLQHQVKRAWLLSRGHRREEIPALLARLAGLAGGNALLLWQIGKLYYHHNSLSEAIDAYRCSLSLRDAPHVRYDLALALFYSGDVAAAEEELDRLISGGARSGAIAYLRSTLRRQTSARNHVDELESWLGDGALQPIDEAGLLYALAKEREDLGEYSSAFTCLLQGARKRRESIDYDVRPVVAGLRDITQATTADALAASSAGSPEAGAIFILGMPRTGTTLTERILAQSGQVGNAGELVDFELLLGRAIGKVRAKEPDLSLTQAALRVDFNEVGRLYMRDARMMAHGASTFIDKMPANFIYCGMIRNALPNARMIHLVRDPLDTCYAIFKTLFFRAYEFSYDLEELADYYIAYRRLMQHWHAVMPGAILDVHYEDLVTDTEGQARRIYDWCGLEWTPEALAVPAQGTVYATASAAQVREPVHARSVASSRRHLDGLEPLVRKLADAGIIDPRDHVNGVG